MTLGLSAPLAAATAAEYNGGKRSPRAVPFVFVGTAAQCGGPAGSNIVTSAWLKGMGLPDDGTTPNPSPNGRDRQRGLLLNKNGPTSNCSSAGTTIEGFRRGSTITELGFDFRIGGHCNNGAPRFNVTTTAGQTFFVGCAFGTHTPAPQDPQWERVRFTAADFFPQGQFVFGVTQVRSISIIHDEGTDTTSPSDPTGVGLAVLDNIAINGRLITTGSGSRP